MGRGELVDGTFAPLAAAREWREVLRVAYASGRGDRVGTHPAPAAAVSSEGLVLWYFWRSCVSFMTRTRCTSLCLLVAVSAASREALRVRGSLKETNPPRACGQM